MPLTAFYRQSGDVTPDSTAATDFHFAALLRRSRLFIVEPVRASLSKIIVTITIFTPTAPAAISDSGSEAGGWRSQTHMQHTALNAAASTPSTSGANSLRRGGMLASSYLTCLQRYMTCPGWFILAGLQANLTWHTLDVLLKVKAA